MHETRRPIDEPASPEAAEAALLALMPDWRADEIVEFAYLSGGYSNMNYRIERNGEAYVFRYVPRARPFVDRILERDLYTRSLALRMPELIAMDCDRGHLLTRYLPGTLLVQANPTLDALADYLRTLHAALPPAPRTYDPLAVAQQQLALGHPPGWIRRLAAQIEWKPGELAACHNDLNPWNVIVPESGDWVTLDWEWYAQNDPLFDVVSLHAGLGLPEDGLPKLARSVLGESVDERLAPCLAVYWLREYAWAHSEWNEGNRRTEIAGQLALAAERLDRIQSGSISG